MPERIALPWTPPRPPDPEPELGDVPSGAAALRPLEWYGEKAAVEAACLLPCKLALGVAKAEMADGGEAERMVDHFRSGATDAVEVDLDRELERNPLLKQLLTSRIESELVDSLAAGRDLTRLTGAIWVGQHDYGPDDCGDDQRMSLGGTFVEYAIVGSTRDGGLEAELHVSDHYFWTPSDASRTTQCLHQCASRMVADGEATEFHQYGDGSMVVADPRSSEAMEAPLVAARGAR